MLLRPYTRVSHKMKPVRVKITSHEVSGNNLPGPGDLAHSIADIGLVHVVAR